MLVDQRTIGRRALLQLIRKMESVPRIELAQRTGISRATVTTTTAELLERGLIEEIPVEPENKELKRGRPKVDLKIRGDAYLIAGAKLANKSIAIVIVNFGGEVVCEHEVSLLKTSYQPVEISKIIRSELQVAANMSGADFADLSAVGLGVAGIVDADKGIVRWSPSLKDRNVDLKEVLQLELGIPVFIDNDANLVAKAEQHFGKGKNVRDFIVVTIENGVGMGIVLNNELYRGTRGCGAEFGHTKVHLDGALCRCGQRGCLEAYVADYALLREQAVGRENQVESTDGDGIARLIDSANNGDKMARSILDRAARMFAMGLSNLINIFDPQLIILSGERMHLDFLYADDVLQSIKDMVVQVDAPPPEIIVHRWGDKMWAKGAAAFAIEGLTDIALSQMADSST